MRDSKLYDRKMENSLLEICKEFYKREFEINSKYPLFREKGLILII
ncbi:MAG: hypothetical protein BAJALOKI2v1_480007 [Promethearchaeota archaeon]|nr:MAG: hypothetical protein BAJALOKI2v1_480007 [Candidatus Lokiarchaeota archaeon]